MPTWGCGSTASRAARGLGLTTSDVLNAERELEVAVSRYLGALGLLCVPVEEADGTARALIERNAIALLAGTDPHRRDRTSPSWLGSYSGRAAVRSSGLWNVKHVGDEYDKGFLDDLERRVRVTDGR